MNNKISSYESKIITILQKEKINFIREKSFKDLHYGYYRYDFYIPSLNIFIECDGEQHFHFTKHFYKNRTEFLKAQERDRNKNNYALANQIKLYRIPYWEIDNINIFSDLIQDKFLVKSQFHNDLAWKNFQLKVNY